MYLYYGAAGNAEMFMTPIGCRVDMFAYRYVIWPKYTVCSKSTVDQSDYEPAAQTKKNLELNSLSRHLLQLAI